MASLIHAIFSRAAFATTAESSSLNRAWVAHKDENVDNHALCRKGLPPPGLGCGQVWTGCGAPDRLKQWSLQGRGQIPAPAL